MGENQSKNSTPERSKPGMTPQEVKKLLEQQKQAFEEKLHHFQLQMGTAQSTAATTPPQRPPPPFVATEATEQTTGWSPVADQRSPVTHMPTRLRASNNTLRSEQVSSHPLQSPPAESPRSTMKPTNTLYPHLENRPMGMPVYPNIPPLFPPVPSTSNTRTSTQTKPWVRQESEDFVFVDKNRNSPQRVTPSAPPAPADEVNKNNWRDRSVSRNRNVRNSDEEELNCRTCRKRYGLTIFQCSAGHSSCRDCKSQDAECGVCGRLITDMRNITLEAYIAEKKGPCSFASEGCNLYIKLADMEAHEKECLFRDMPCPVSIIFGRCTWQGKVSKLLDHFDVNHPEYRAANIDTEMYLFNIRDSTHRLHLIEIGTYLFLLHIKVDDTANMLYMAVQLLGTRTSASKWSFEVQIYNKREPRRKYQYTDICQSNAVPIQEIFQEAKCVSIPICQALTYINESRLTYKFYITKPDSGNVNQRGRGNWRGRGRGRGSCSGGGS